jgi:hypothetical protein
MSALTEYPAFDRIDPSFDVFDLGSLVVTGHEDVEIWGVEWENAVRSDE